jgi:hypothetical protein
MTRDMRLRLFEIELRRLLHSNVEHDYVIFRDVRDPDHYVLYMRHDRATYGEVGWLTPVSGKRQLRPQVERAIGCLGFTGAGPRRKYSRDHLPQDTRKLACLTELLFGAAHGETEDLSVIAMTRPSMEAERQPLRMELEA